MWFVTYAKVTDDKEEGIKLVGVYFGGAADSKEGADTIARECLNTIKGGTVIPRTFHSDRKCSLPSVMDEAATKFNKIVDQMRVSSEIINRGQRRR